MPRGDYAHFLLAICYYEQIVDEKKDIGPLLSAQEQFKIVIDNYPNSEKEISVISRIDTEKEVDYFKNDGILPYVFNLIQA